MSDETVVALYDTPSHAEAAVAAVKAAGIPTDAISKHAGPRKGTATSSSAGPGEPVREEGFWASLFGGTPDYDTAVYDRSLDRGSTLVSVKVPDAPVARLLDILDSHNPIDIDQRAASYGQTPGPATERASSVSAAIPAASAATARTTSTDETVQLSEEALAVGKRLVNRGETRIRRYVVETPVEENVTLHSERVVLKRRPVTDNRPVDADGFSDKTIEMTETVEEAVVSKTARVVEEIGLRKEVSDRVETVRDTVRKGEAEVVQVPGTETAICDAKAASVATTGGAGGTTARANV